LKTRVATRPLRAWPVAIILALAPVWLIGIFHRGLWTPDEPREADIAWRMSQQSDRTLPHLADMPFLEKPPLSYWLSAASIEKSGDSPAAARAPNILYAMVTALSLGALAFAMSAVARGAGTGPTAGRSAERAVADGRAALTPVERRKGATAAFLAATFAATALIVFRVEVWLAPDAGLLAGCSLALLGAWLGYTASPGRLKLAGYTLMHAGAATGFMFKSAPGWLAPALALLTIVIWERRWSELVRWELYAGFLLQIAIIAPWIHAVMQTPDGDEALRAFFWNNVVGRFTHVSAPAALDYTTGHQNWAGKYLIELPAYLFPWTLIAVAALARAWKRVRSVEGTGWRFAVGAAVPFLVALSLSATARDIYAAPAVLGLCLLMALWAVEIADTPGRLDRFALRGTRVLIALIACVFVGLLGVLAAARGGDIASAEEVSAVVLLAAAVLVPPVTLVALWLASAAQRRGDIARTLHWSYAAYAGALCVAALAAFPAVDRWQDLPDIARDIHRDSGSPPLGLLDPDETTIAMLDHKLRTRFVILTSSQSSPPAAVVADWFRSHGAHSRVLVNLPGHAPGELSRFMDRWHPRAPPGDGTTAMLIAKGDATLMRRYELPQGRRYALLGPP
jgi:4-amino-4-deoxy-L-arabinose transferase-like glycosyltransferase